MKRSNDDSAAHDLRDHPVPPVKGAVTAPQDIRPRPKQETTGETVRLGDSALPDSWM